MEDEYSKFLLTAISIRFQSNAIAKYHKNLGTVLNETLSKKSDIVPSWLVAASEKVLRMLLFIQICLVVLTNLWW